MLDAVRYSKWILKVLGLPNDIFNHALEYEYTRFFLSRY